MAADYLLEKLSRLHPAMVFWTRSTKCSDLGVRTMISLLSSFFAGKLTLLSTMQQSNQPF